MNGPEHWLRGPVAGIPPLLQPVAHALLQARDEVNVLMRDFPEELLWERPMGLASPGEQLATLAAEGRPEPGAETVQGVLNQFNRQVDKALEQIARTSGSLTEVRTVGKPFRQPNGIIARFH